MNRPVTPLRSPQHLGDDGAQQALGALAAQRVLDSLHGEWTTAGSAWVVFAELAARHGWKSPACQSFIVELTKRARK